MRPPIHVAKGVGVVVKHVVYRANSGYFDYSEKSALTQNGEFPILAPS